jgi:hypothetical protein
MSFRFYSRKRLKPLKFFGQSMAGVAAMLAIKSAGQHFGWMGECCDEFSLAPLSPALPRLVFTGG